MKGRQLNPERNEQMNTSIYPEVEQIKASTQSKLVPCLNCGRWFNKVLDGLTMLKCLRVYWVECKCGRYTAKHEDAAAVVDEWNAWPGSRRE